MKFNKIIFSTALGFAFGFLVGQSLKKVRITPEKALKIAKEKFKVKGPVSGSWIYMKPQDLSKEGIEYCVYYGGISRNINGKTIQYEFYIDTNTGTIIDVSRLEPITDDTRG